VGIRLLDANQASLRDALRFRPTYPALKRRAIFGGPFESIGGLQSRILGAAGEHQGPSLRSG
jgi:hypothetical protein